MIKQFLKDQEGQTTVEYLLIIGVVVVVISVLGKTMQGQIGTVVNNIFDGVNQKIKGLMSAANSN